MVAATASRVSAWVNATIPASGLEDQSGLAGRGRARPRPPRRPGRRPRRARRASSARPSTAARSSSDRVCSGSPAEASGDHVAHRRRQARSVSAAESGELDQEERVAARAGLPLGDHVRHRCRRRAHRPTPGSRPVEPDRGRGGRRAAGRAPRRRRRARRSARGTVGRVSTTASCWPGALEAISRRSTRRLAVSAQCRSSSTTSSGAASERVEHLARDALPGPEPLSLARCPGASCGPR